MRQRVPSALYGTLLAGSALLSGCASVAQAVHPPIQADLSLEALKRGESLFRGPREGCGWLGDSVSMQAVEPGTPVRTSAAAQLADLVLAQAEPKKDVDAAALFARLGCTVCHAPGARYHDRIGEAVGKSEQELAKWIRNPEQFVPGTTMPTYSSLIDEPTALALAKWLKSGGPNPGK
ncbi:hypothetical protein [Archangium sp.]|uniref:c-type cytochrome n=1 Tax=Archangium sp. TaxID=1872627 RepID=UPI002D361AC0|nr:hypothetical protein [Archangium sp.]HYO57043.1 hypothetical protein [Archangium sp.]